MACPDYAHHLRWLIRWADRMDREHPGADFWPTASLAMQKAFVSYREGDGSTFGTWLRSKLRGELHRTLRSHRTAHKNRERYARPEGHSDPGFAAADARDELAAVDRRIARLLPQDRAAMAVFATGVESPTAIAQVMGITRQVAAKRLDRSLAALRAAV